MTAQDKRTRSARVGAALGLAALATTAAVASCHAPPGQYGKAAAPPDVVATCTLTAEGATCQLENSGGVGERCVRILYASRAAATIVASDVLCSGVMGIGAVRTVAARFPKRPGDVCRPALADCVVKVVDRRAAAETMRTWQAQLDAASPPPPNQAECRTMTDHLFELAAAAWTADALTEQDRVEVQRELVIFRDKYLGDLLTRCHNELSRRQLECAMKATVFTEVRSCVP